jgi:hypothetical protein
MVLYERNPMHPKLMRKKIINKIKVNGFYLNRVENLLVWQQVYLIVKLRLILTLQSSH